MLAGMVVVPCFKPVSFLIFSTLATEVAAEDMAGVIACSRPNSFLSLATEVAAVDPRRVRTNGYSVIFKEEMGSKTSSTDPKLT